MGILEKILFTLFLKEQDEKKKKLVNELYNPLNYLLIIYLFFHKDMEYFIFNQIVIHFYHFLNKVHRD